LRKTLVAVLLLCLLFALPSPAFAESLMDKVQQTQAGGGGAIAAEVDRIGLSIVEFVRGIFVVIAVVVVIWLAFVFLFSSGNPQAMAQAKKLAAGLIICVIGVYSAETIVGGILGLLGYGGGAAP
jgi:hypothetical protein